MLPHTAGEERGLCPHPHRARHASPLLQEGGGRPVVHRPCTAGSSGTRAPRAHSSPAALPPAEGGAEMASTVSTQAQAIRLKFSALLGCPFPILCTEERRFFRGANFCLVAGFSGATPRIHRTQERKKKQPRTSGPGCHFESQSP